MNKALFFSVFLMVAGSLLARPPIRRGGEITHFHGRPSNLTNKIALTKVSYIASRLMRISDVEIISSKVRGDSNAEPNATFKFNYQACGNLDFYVRETQNGGVTYLEVVNRYKDDCPATPILKSASTKLKTKRVNNRRFVVLNPILLATDKFILPNPRLEIPNPKLNKPELDPNPHLVLPNPLLKKPNDRLRNPRLCTAVFGQVIDPGSKRCFTFRNGCELGEYLKDGMKRAKVGECRASSRFR